MPGHVTKKNNRWYAVVEYRDEMNKRKRKWHSGFRTKKEASKFLNEQLYKLERGTYVEPTKFKFKDFLIAWLNDYAKPNTAPLTYQGYEAIIFQHVIPELGHYTLDKLKPPILQKYYTDRLENGRKNGKGGLSPRTVLHHHRLIHEALEHAVLWQMIPTNHAKKVCPPKPTKKRVNTLNKQEIQRLLTGIRNSSIYDYVFFALNTGMRRGEIFGLRWSDIDFVQETLSVSQTLQQLKKEGLVIRPATKTDGSQRTVALSKSVINHLIKIKQKQTLQYQSMMGVNKKLNLVFAYPDGSPIKMNQVSTNFGKWIKRLNLPKICFHDLRHLHATLLLQNGIHPKIVSERLGHSKSSFTMDTYLHVMPNMQKEAAYKLDNFLFDNDEALLLN